MDGLFIVDTKVVPVIPRALQQRVGISAANGTVQTLAFPLVDDSLPLTRGPFFLSSNLDIGPSCRIRRGAVGFFP